MPLPIHSQQLSLISRVPMPLMAIFIGLFCGLVVWTLLDQVQPRALNEIFAQELETRLEQQARETLIRFDNYVSAHTSTTRLLANHRNLANYLEPIYWFENSTTPAIHYAQTPPWLPATSLWQTLVRPSHILLVDSQGRIRENYQVDARQLPEELLKGIELAPSESRVQAKLAMFEERSYILILETAEDATGTQMGALVLVAPIDAQFLIASQQGISSDGVLVGIIDADEQQFLASSNEMQVDSGVRMQEVSEDYLVTAQSFSQYEGSNLNLQFATLVPHQVVDRIRQHVAGLERRQRVVAGISFIGIFTLVFFLLSQRLNNILRRISRFSQRALGAKQPVIERGNQLFVLEDWIQQFIQLVRDTRDEMRQQHESEMQESEMLKQVIMETALDSIITIDLNGCIIEFNHTAEQAFDCDRDQVIGRLFSSSMLDVNSGQQFDRLLKNLLNRAEEEFTDLRHEMVALNEQGDPFPVELAIKPIRLKNRTAFTVYLHDISSRRRAEQEILSLARFVSESPSPVLRVNRPGVITYANAASDHLLDYWDCTRSQTLPLYWRSRVAEMLTSGEVWRTQLICGEHVYSLLFAPVREQGYVNIYGRDITGERQAERLAREHQQELVHVCRLSTLGEMATGLAHELNQPLSAIANYANGSIRRLQGSDKQSEDILYALGQISAQSSRAGEIIRRLRGLVGKQPPIRAVCDINQLVREVCSFVEFEASKAGVVIEQELSLTPLPSKIDLVQIEQVMLNLLRNALDALLDVSEQERRLVIQTDMHDAEWVLIRVLDSGPGINEEAMQRLFEPFYTTKVTGMGMGLVISQTIMQDHNGTITAGRSEYGGTCFSVMLPSYGKKDGE